MARTEMHKNAANLNVVGGGARTCPFWKKGHCKHGDQCTMAHGKTTGKGGNYPALVGSMHEGKGGKGKGKGSKGKGKGKSKDGGKGACYNCGNTGRFARDCPNDAAHAPALAAPKGRGRGKGKGKGKEKGKQKGGQKGGKGKPIVCYKCGEEGHKSTECGKQGLKRKHP